MDFAIVFSGLSQGRKQTTSTVTFQDFCRNGVDKFSSSE
jgi:hypothetical protein